VAEPEAVAKGWAAKHGFSFPVLLDLDGAVAARYPPADAVPDLPRDQVAVAGNLIIGPEGRIEFYTLLDSMNFDARLTALRERLDALLAGK